MCGHSFLKTRKILFINQFKFVVILDSFYKYKDENHCSNHITHKNMVYCCYGLKEIYECGTDAS